MTRLLDYYVETATTAVSVAHPELSRLRGIKPTFRTVDPAWLDVERSNLLAAAAFSADHGWPHHAQRFSAASANRRRAAAVDDHETALAIAADFGNRHERERAERGLALARHGV